MHVGSTFDAMGPHGLLITGTIYTLIGIFALSFCIGNFRFLIDLHA